LSHYVYDQPKLIAVDHQAPRFSVIVRTTARLPRRPCADAERNRSGSEASAFAAGVERVGVYMLRHSAAVGWLESGVHIKAVADLLGHSSISITGDIYGHTSDETARSAVDGWSGVLGL
jgi:site-specific recombinase XerD